MTAIEAAKRAFLECKRNHAKSRAVCSYLTRQHLIHEVGMPSKDIEIIMPELEPFLDDWFEQRKLNPNFVPIVED